MVSRASSDAHPPPLCQDCVHTDLQWTTTQHKDTGPSGDSFQAREHLCLVCALRTTFPLTAVKARSHPNVITLRLILNLREFFLSGVSSVVSSDASLG